MQYDPTTTTQPQTTAPAEGETRKDDLHTDFLGGRGDDNSLYEGWNLGDRWA